MQIDKVITRIYSGAPITSFTIGNIYREPNTGAMAVPRLHVIDALLTSSHPECDLTVFHARLCRAKGSRTTDWQLGYTTSTASLPLSRSDRPAVCGAVPTILVSDTSTWACIGTSTARMASLFLFSSHSFQRVQQSLTPPHRRPGAASDPYLGIFIHYASLTIYTPPLFVLCTCCCCKTRRPEW